MQRSRTLAVVVGVLSLAGGIATLVKQPSLPVSSKERGEEVKERSGAVPRSSYGRGAGSRSVYYDLVGDVLDSSGEGVAGATVCAWINVDGALLRASSCTTTDGAGAFSLAQLPGGTEMLSASGQGFENGVSEVSLPQVGGLRVVLRLNQVSALIEGRVADASGGAVVGATLSAHPRGPSPLNRRELGPVALATSSDSGGFRLAVPKGEFDVVAIADGYAASELAVVAPGAPVDIALAPAGRVTGDVVDLSGNPVAFARVAAEASGALPAWAESTTDSAGQFAIHHVAPGPYSVSVVGDDWHSDSANVFVDAGLDSAGIRLVAHGAASIQGKVTLASRPCASGELVAAGPVLRGVGLSGQAEVQLAGLAPGEYQLRIRCEGALGVDELLVVADPMPEEQRYRVWTLEAGRAIHGKLVVSSHTNLAELSIRAELTSPEPGASNRPRDAEPASGPNLPTPIVSECPVAEDRTFHCLGVSPGRHSVTVSGALRKLVTVEVSVPADGDASVEVALPDFGSIHVRVEPPGVSSPQVLVESQDGTKPLLARRAMNGSYSATQLVPGPYLVRFSGESRGSEIAVRPGETSEITLRAPTTELLRGRVLDAQNLPVPDAWVIAHPQGYAFSAPTLRTLTSAVGWFEFRDVPRGSYELQIEAAGSMVAGVANTGVVSILYLSPRKHTVASQ